MISADRRIWSHTVVTMTASAGVVHAAWMNDAANGQRPAVSPERASGPAGAGQIRIGAAPWAAIHSAGTNGHVYRILFTGLW